jgi:tetratricopeptide (TPR) repeat protein
MRKNLLIPTLLLSGSALFAQQLPTPSSLAAVEQRIGLTDVRVEYHRPNVNQREVFGGLVPYNTLWRTGANKATAISFSSEVNILDNVIPAGTYSVFAIPSPESWTIAINSATELWGTGNYKEENDLLRVTVPTSETGFTESFLISFEEVKRSSGNLCMSWENTKVCLPIQVDVDAKALENIKAAVAEQPDNWGVLRNSASYYMDNNVDHAQALTWMQKSVELKGDNWYSLYLLGRAYHLNGDRKNAVKTGKSALSLYQAQIKESNSPATYEGMLTSAIEEWGKKK